MDRLWQRLVEIYGSAFTSQFGDVGGEGYETWLVGLSDIRPEQIRSALEKAVKSGSDYAPNLSTFYGYCVDLESYGLPTADLAFNQACQATTQSAKNRLHPAVYHAAADTGWFDLRNGYARQRLFSSHYDKRVKQVMAGEVLEIPKVDLIERKKPEPLSAEVQRQRCASLREMLAS